MYVKFLGVADDFHGESPHSIVHLDQECSENQDILENTMIETIELVDSDSENVLRDTIESLPKNHRKHRHLQPYTLHSFHICIAIQTQNSLHSFTKRSQK